MRNRLIEFARFTAASHMLRKINHYDQRSCNQRLSLLQMMSRVAISSSNLRVPSSACSWARHFCSDTTCHRVDVLMVSRVFRDARVLKPLCVSSARQRLGCSTDVTHGWRCWRATANCLGNCYVVPPNLTVLRIRRCDAPAAAWPQLPTGPRGIARHHNWVELRAVAFQIGFEAFLLSHLCS